jgi:hypothetical protein
MEETSVLLEFPAIITQTDDEISISAEIKVESPQLPILNQPDPEIVNKDEIVFGISFLFS